MGWRLYNTKTHKKVEIDTQVFDPQIVALYDPKTHRLVEKFDWDPDNFETREELETFLTEFLGFEPDPEGIHKKPMTFDWETDVTEEIIILDRQVTAREHAAKQLA